MFRNPRNFNAKRVHAVRSLSVLCDRRCIVRLAQFGAGSLWLKPPACATL
jgi:hypothetical protein